MEEALAIAQVRTGDADAFGVIVENYQAPIQRYLYRLTGDLEVAKDLAQDTFVQAYSAILKTDSQLSLRAWLYRIATNNALHARRHARLLSFIPLDPQQQGDPAVGIQTGVAAENIAVADALRQVPPGRRVCMVLHLVEGFTYREIAETLGISEDAVRKRVAKGKIEFRECYDSKEGEDEVL